VKTRNPETARSYQALRHIDGTFAPGASGNPAGRPPRRSRLIAIEMPNIETAADLLRAQALIVDAIGAGEITLEEGAEMTKVLDAVGSAFERRDREAGVAVLEANGTAK
jgi:hypothetical protein